MNSFKVYRKSDDFRVKTPHSVQDLIEIRSIAENGIFETAAGVYTKTYKISDVNYEAVSFDEQVDMLDIWCSFLNSQQMQFEITWNNKNRSEDRLRKEVFYTSAGDDGDKFRSALNDEIDRKLKEGRSGIEQELFITLRYDRSDSYDDAKLYFNTAEAGLSRKFADFGSSLTPLDADMRLRVLHDIYCFGHEEDYRYNFRSAVENRQDFLDFISPSRITIKDECIQFCDTQAACMYVKDYNSATISDRFLIRLMSLDIRMMGSITCIPIPGNAASDLLKTKYLQIEDRIRKQNSTRVKNMDFSSDISLTVRDEKETVEGLIEENKKDDQHFFYTMVNIMLLADSEEELKKAKKLLADTANGDGIILDIPYMQQRETLNTILPLGLRQVENGRNLFTKSLAAFYPFKAQELVMKNGTWYGSNIISKNIVMADRKKLMNPHGFIFGVTGSGKTTTCKLELLQNYLRTEDDIVIIDPKNDYIKITEALSGTYINISTASGSRYNPLEAYGKVSAADKTDIVLAIAETCKRAALTPKERNVLDRALKFMLTESELKGKQPCLTGLYSALEKLESDEAKDVMGYLELFVTGSFNIFAHESNVDMGKSRLTVFGLRDMGTELRDLTMLIMLECVLERIKANAAAGRGTWLYIDECHELMHTQYQIEFVKKLWVLVRSLGGICTGLTQNVSDVCANATTKALIENSEFLIIMKQKDSAVPLIKDMLGLSDEMIRYTTRESRPGRGLVRAGSVTVPFDLEVSVDSEFYTLGIVDHDFHTINRGEA